MSAVEEIQAAIDALTALRDGGTAGPFFKDDCEGEIRVFPERLLRNVSRDESGQITSYRTPGSWGTDEMVIDYEVESWDEGQDKQDDRMRANAEMFVTLHRTIDAQLTILQGDVMLHAAYLEKGLEDHWLTAVERAGDLALARAINGGAA